MPARVRNKRVENKTYSERKEQWHRGGAAEGQRVQAERDVGHFVPSCSPPCRCALFPPPFLPFSAVSCRWPVSLPPAETNGPLHRRERERERKDARAQDSAPVCSPLVTISHGTGALSVRIPVALRSHACIAAHF